MPIASPSDDDNDKHRGGARVFFARGRTVADTGNFEYAIEMYIQGLNVDPENIEAHQALRDISLRRTASGGKDMSMMEKMKLPKAREEKQEMLNAEKLLAYMPGDVSRMQALLDAAHRAGMSQTAAWIAAILRRATRS
jgi:hypothetical protein